MKELVIQVRETGVSMNDIASFLEKHPKHSKKIIVLSVHGQTMKVKSSIAGKRLAKTISKGFDGLSVTAQEPNHQGDH